jgi:hypothetical protein
VTHPVADHVATLHQRFVDGQPLTRDDIAVLFQAIALLQQEPPSVGLVHLSQNDLDLMAVVYNTLMVALRQAGLHLQRVTATDGVHLPWVWFYRWSGCTRQGPFGTLEAAVGAAVLQVRSGAIKQA